MKSSLDDKLFWLKQRSQTVRISDLPDRQSSLEVAAQAAQTPKTPAAVSEGFSASNYHALVTEDSNEFQYRLLQRRLNRSPFTLYPDSIFRQCWDWFHASLILIECITLPFLLINENLRMELGMRIDYKAVIVGCLMEISMVVDILLNLNTGYFDKGIIVMSRKNIALNYLKSGSMIFDMILITPIFLVMLILLHAERVDLLPD